MARRRRAGRDLYLRDWRTETSAHDERQSLIDSVVRWCRETVAATRRPFGIDHFDLALAWRESGATAVRSQRFLQLRPIDLYTERFLAQLHALLFGPEPAFAGVHLSVAVFSWGDAAHAELDR
jgi:hypothetical protein